MNISNFLKFLNEKMKLLCICVMLGCVCVYHGMCVEVREETQLLVLTFHLVEAGSLVHQCMSQASQPAGFQAAHPATGVLRLQMCAALSCFGDSHLSGNH